MPGGFEASYNFNLYDIFANFLPGSVLLLGLLLPSLGVEGLLIDLNLGSALVFLILSFAAGLVVQACGYKIHSGAEQFDDHLEEFDKKYPEENEDPEEDNTSNPETTSDSNDESDCDRVNDNDGDDALSDDNESEGESDEDNDREPDDELVVPDDELPDEGTPLEEIESIDTDFIELVRDERNYGPQYDNWTNLYTWVLVRLDDSSRTRAIRLHGLFLATRGMFVASIILFVFYLLTFFTLSR